MGPGPGSIPWFAGGNLTVGRARPATIGRMDRFPANRFFLHAALVAGLLSAGTAGAAEPRTVFRCVARGTVSLSTAPEPGSRCEAKTVQDEAGQAPNLWGSMGVFSGTLYQRQQEGVTVYGTRNLPGSTVYLRFTVATPAGEPAHPGLGKVGKPRLEMFVKEFRSAAKATGLDEAWLRAIAHAESGFQAFAVSPKGAQGVMQLMPDLAREYGVVDPFSPAQSINAGARHLKWLSRRYGDDRVRIAAAYNAGVGALELYDGVPPYKETREYVDKVQALYQAYRQAMGTAPLTPADSRPVMPGAGAQ